jgi:RNA recognition motif-containing protein
MKIQVRNIDRGVTEAMLREKFAEHGAVESAVIVMDKRTGLSKGFGFVEMPSRAEGEAAIKALDRMKLLKEKIKVKESVPAEGGQAVPGENK